MRARSHLIPSIIIISIILLLGTFGKWPYDYYTILRFVVCGSAVYTAFLAFEWKRKNFTWVFGIIAVLFNPFFKVHFEKELWLVIDLAAAIIFAVGIVVLKKADTVTVEEAKSTEEIILAHLKQNTYATRSDLLPLVKVSKATLVRVLDGLEERNLVEQVGERKGARYKLR